ncbi:MAG: Uma2 family endonuclease [Cyanobacteria bacterium J06638_22]
MVLQPPVGSPAVPPLASGDRLTRSEFEHRYKTTSEAFKAELIEGVVYVASPVRNLHGNPHFNVITWLGVYSAATPGVSGADNTTTRLDLDNEPQPDALLRIATGGTSRISEDGYVEGAPELVAEIATSSAALDFGEKMNAYRRNGVQEYLVWDTFENRIRWYQLQNEEFVVLEPDAEGIIRSRVFPGLWLVVPALLSGDMMAVLKVVQRGLADPAHQAFLKTLAQQPDV